MNKLGKAVLIAGGMVTVGALSYLNGMFSVIFDLEESSETAYNIYSYDVKNRPVNTISDYIKKLTIHGNECADQIIQTMD